MAAVAVEELAYEEVADYAGTTEEAAEEEIIPTPPLMDFNLWQKWRKEYGLRPTKRLGSRNPTSSKQESACWRRVMKHYHGEDWQDILAGEAMDPEEKEESFDPLTDPQFLAAALSGVAPPTSEAVVAPSGVAQRLLGAGSGLQTFDLNEGAGQEDRRSSDITSSNQSGPGTPRGLIDLLDKQYDPAKELYARYEKRVRRVVDALAMLDVHTDELRVCTLLWAAEIKGLLYPQGK